MGKDFTPPPRAKRHCRHYSYDFVKVGTLKAANCAVGLDLTMPMATAKCMPDANFKCHLREEHTPTEHAAWEQFRNERLDRMGKAFAALPRPIPIHTSGTVECPNCSGKLNYARWHRGAEVICETPFCVGLSHISITPGADWPAPKTGDAQA